MSDVVRIQASEAEVIVHGFAPEEYGGEKITNVGRGRITLVSDTGERIVLEPGESGVLRRPKGAYRMACPECGLHTGVHETWCPLWEPY